jgi:hypothetical protein
MGISLDGGVLKWELSSNDPLWMGIFDGHFGPNHPKLVHYRGIFHGNMIEIQWEYQWEYN